MPQQRPLIKRVYPEQPLLGVGAVVLQDDKILLVKRRNEPSASCWTLPGGLVELGETVHEAIIREIWEECGIEVVLNKIMDVIDYIKVDNMQKVQYHYVLIDFEAQYKGGTLKPASDIVDAKWFVRSELTERTLPEITERFLKKYYF